MVSVYILDCFEWHASNIAITTSGAIFIYIAKASPNRASLGATNGLSQVSLSCIQPSIAVVN